jgi:hypothetical protein
MHTHTRARARMPCLGIQGLRVPRQCCTTHTYTSRDINLSLDGLLEDALDLTDALDGREVHVLVSHLHDDAAQDGRVHLLRDDEGLASSLEVLESLLHRSHILSIKRLCRRDGHLR